MLVKTKFLCPEVTKTHKQNVFVLLKNNNSFKHIRETFYFIYLWHYACTIWKEILFSVWTISIMSAGILIFVTIVFRKWSNILGNIRKHKLIDLKILLSFVVVVPVSNSPRYGHVALGQSLSLTWSRNGRWAAFMHAHTNISLLLVSSVIE